MNRYARRLFKKLRPLLWFLYKVHRKFSKSYQTDGFNLVVLTGVFHPGMLLSTGVFVDFLKTQQLAGKRVLELGAGAGLISCYCAREGAVVTASDINPTAIDGLKLNAEKNKLDIFVVQSDLFENLNADSFDLLLINPPYYPKVPKNHEEMAWYCGQDFEYFQRLFQQLAESTHRKFQIFMILSQDCEIEHIMKMAGLNGFDNKLIYEKRIKGEWNYIYCLNAKRSLADKNVTSPHTSGSL